MLQFCLFFANRFLKKKERKFQWNWFPHEDDPIRQQWDVVLCLGWMSVPAAWDSWQWLLAWTHQGSVGPPHWGQAHRLTKCNKHKITPKTEVNDWSCTSKLPSPVPPSPKKLVCSGIQGSIPALTCSLLNEMVLTVAKACCYARQASISPFYKKQALRFRSQPARAAQRKHLPSGHLRSEPQWTNCETMRISVSNRFEREEKRRWPHDSNYKNKQLWLSSKNPKRDSD